MVDLDFSRRAELEEEIDGPCSYEELRACLRDLSLVNRLTCAHRPVMNWLERVADRRRAESSGVPLRIVDVGCGYGDMLRRIGRWAKRRGVAVELIGVDINENAVRAAREATPADAGIRWIAGEVHGCADVQQVDIVLSSGVMHHLTEAQIVRMLGWMEGATRAGWFVADLHRQPMPYRIFNRMMWGPWWHRFIRPDGMVSIRRSFMPEDWRRMCLAAGLDLGTVRIEEYRPARLCVERVKQAEIEGFD